MGNFFAKNKGMSETAYFHSTKRHNIRSAEEDQIQSLLLVTEEIYKVSKLINDSPGRSESIGLALRSERSAFPFEAGMFFRPKPAEEHIP